MSSRILNLNRSLLLNSSIKSYSKLAPSIVDSVKSIFGKENFTVSDSVRQHHSKDESLHKFVVIHLSYNFDKLF
jgi:hypothetical protein